MATNQVMREAVYEGILYIFLKAGVACDVCDVVTLDAANPGEFKLCGDTDVPFGYVAEKVTTIGVADYEPGGLVSHTAKVGDYVGVYINGGVYNHRDPVDAAFGDLLYVGTTDGKVSATAGSATIPVGICTGSEDTDTGICQVKSLL